MSTDYYIPYHVLVDILLRLPFDSLFRFKCVSKSWRDLIDSSYFKEMHTRSPIRHSKMIALVRKKSVVYTFDSVVKNGRIGYTAVAKKLSSPILECEDRYDLEVTESCNGIVLFTSSLSHNVVLWNPFTGSTLYSHQLTSPPDEFTMDWRYIQTAFGYDHLNDDYKLVRWHVSGAANWCGRGRNLYEVCVYSFKHKSWRTITDARKLGLYTRDGYLPRQLLHTCANGAMHWVVGMSILAFDLGTYKFQIIPCATPDLPAATMSLSSLNGCLCLCTYSISTRLTWSADVWVMKEYGIESSWTKVACIELKLYQHMKAMKAVAYSEKRWKLMLQPMSGEKLFKYDLDTKSLRDVAVKPEEDLIIKDDEDEDEDEDGFFKLFADRCTSCVCVGSFVSPHLL